jgi:2-C-methyl-D-erythritol 2,4-cyclodiphosphate synthase
LRIGFGYDAHRLERGRRCVLCGVDIPSDFGPDGHSDADVPLHALMDALLGALALGDIGGYFPDSDEKWRMADSVEMLKTVYAMICSRGYKLGNTDITIVLQSPRLSPYIGRMRETIAGALGADIGVISIKATTEERMGFTGDGTGISATAVVLLL